MLFFTIIKVLKSDGVVEGGSRDLMKVKTGFSSIGDRNHEETFRL